MKTNLLFKLILITAFFFPVAAKAQSDNIGYAVTDSIPNGIKWNFLRTVDTRNGIYSDTILRLISNSELMPGNGILPFNGVAAIALDKRNKRLYYTPMLVDRLSYVDLRTMKIVVVTNNFTGLMPKQTDQSNIFTRMVIANDGNGYAISNDGNHLVRFTATNNPVITDLGALVDAQSNNENSVHIACGNNGGDIISDDEGNLYLISFGNSVFKINIQSRQAAYLGKITGLPANFATSGVVVITEGNNYSLVIASSIDTSSIYKLNLNTLVAAAVNPNTGKHTSDLTNGVILKTGRQFVSSKLLISNINSDKVQVYPNPVLTDEFKILFNTEAGAYRIDIIDAKGQIISSKTVNVSGANSVVEMNLKGIIAKGIFVVKVTGKGNKAVFSDKIVLQ